MRFYTSLFLLLFTSLLITGCASLSPSVSPPIPQTLLQPSATQIAAAQQVGIDTVELTTLINTRLFEMKPDQIGRYIAYLQVMEPNFRARIARLARKNIGQPYELYLLGEFPFENIDDQPLFDLQKSDCVVFAEHTYAMALSQSWPEFFWMLQRIRYRDGVIGVTTRNHYTETDWNPQNAWLVSDISAMLAKERTATYSLTVDRTKFFKTRYKIDHAVPIEKTVESYVPKAEVANIAAQLQEGDFVNVISGQNGNFWASHVGIVVIGPNGERHMIHSAEPSVREETFEAFITRATEREARQAAAGKPGKLLAGFKFLRLNDAPVVPPMAAQPRPRPTLPNPQL
jgi:Protein of unknown function (DUF1460)